MKTFHSLLALTGAALLAGCDSESAPLPPVRPVLSAVAERQNLALNAFAGTIEPRYSSSLAFRAGGRVIAREVNAGDSVQKGARLAALDPLVFDLALRDAQAGLANAIAVLDNAAAAEKRYRVLFDGKHTSAQQLEAVHLGTTVTAYAPAQTAGQLTIPVSAVFERGGKHQVWIVDPALKTIALRDVNVSSGDGGNAAVKAGLEPGDRVVTAGVYSLEPGQSVKIPEEAPK